jgi:hypothetical protein
VSVGFSLHLLGSELALNFIRVDDSYNIFDKPLFKGSSATMMYRPKSNADTDVYGGYTIDKLLKFQIQQLR